MLLLSYHADSFIFPYACLRRLAVGLLNRHDVVRVLGIQVVEYESHYRRAGLRLLNGNIKVELMPFLHTRGGGRGRV